MNSQYQWTDSPLETESQDEFGRGHFAGVLANALMEDCSEKARVVGLVGPWGSGKSSVARFALNRIKEVDGSRPVVWFEPWLVGSKEALVVEFFSELGKALLPRGDGAKDRSMRTRFYKYAARTASALSATSSIGGMMGLPLAGMIAAILKGGEEVLQATATAIEGDAELPTLKDLRDSISQDLGNQSAHLIVIIDDIDRLSATEIRTVFQLVKACADFPNVTYLLLFDQKQVVRALSDAEEESLGLLDKIVNQILDLPIATHAQRERFLEKNLELLGASALPVESRLRMHVVAQSILLPGLSSVRHVKRFFASAALLLNELRGETHSNIDLPDFLVLEYIRQHIPDLYSVLKEEGQQLPGIYPVDSSYLSQEKEIKERRRLAALPKDEMGKMLADASLRLLEPVANPSDLILRARRTRQHIDRRFGSYQWRGVYLGFNAKHAWLQDQDWSAVKSDLADLGGTHDWISILEDPDRRATFARSVADRVIDLNIDQVRNLIEIVSNWEWSASIDFSGKETQGCTRLTAATIIISQCLLTLADESEILLELKQLLRRANILGCVAQEVARERSFFDRGHYEGVYMDRDSFKRARRILSPKLKNLVDRDLIFNYHEPGRILNTWRNVAGNKAYDEWLESLKVDQGRMAKYVNSVLAIAVVRDKKYDWNTALMSNIYLALECVDEGLLSEDGKFARMLILESCQKNAIATE